MMFFLLVSSALALPPVPERPAPPEKVQGECRVNYPISQGRLLPEGLAISSVQAKCSSIAVPLSEYADLLATEQWSLALDKRYKIDTSLLEKDLEWYKNRLAEETKQKPFLERPSTQRWLGRIETLIVVGIVSASIGATYHYTGAGK
tara:strand:+ start:4440 stop:4880 length:441 start_codon:yes stop_codon:yes gene_type:complete